MLEINLAVIAAVAIVLGLASRPLRRLPLSEPLVALALGALLGPELAGLLALPAGQETAVLRVTAELVLAISLMAVALRFPLDDVRAQLLPVSLLITVGMVVMAAATALLGVAALPIGLAEAALLGAALAPTDPVLASSIVTGAPAEEALPERLRIVLSMESGANDGLAFVLVGLGAVAASHLAAGPELRRMAVQLVVGVGVGAAAGLAVGRLVHVADERHEIEHTAFLVLTLALAVFVLGAATALRGQGVLAVFVAGLAYNRQISRKERKEEWEVQEAVNQFLVLPAFVLLGVALPWSAWGVRPWTLLVFAVGVLLLRRLPWVVAAARPLRLPLDEAAFLGWFGPIGVAALFYLAEGREQGHVTVELWAAGTFVIALSTLVHGVTAMPGRALFARQRKSSHPAHR